jgi:hypothetical protein
MSDPNQPAPESEPKETPDERRQREERERQGGQPPQPEGRQRPAEGGLLTDEKQHKTNVTTTELTDSPPEQGSAAWAERHAERSEREGQRQAERDA